MASSTVSKGFGLPRQGKSEMQVPFSQILGEKSPLKLPELPDLELLEACRGRLAQFLIIFNYNRRRGRDGEVLRLDGRLCNVSCHGLG